MGPLLAAGKCERWPPVPDHRLPSLSSVKRLREQAARNTPHFASLAHQRHSRMQKRWRRFAKCRPHSREHKATHRRRTGDVVYRAFEERVRIMESSSLDWHVGGVRRLRLPRLRCFSYRIKMGHALSHAPNHSTYRIGRQLAPPRRSKSSAWALSHDLATGYRDR